MSIVNAAFTVLLLAAGYLFKKNKAKWLMLRYKSLTEDEETDYDIKALSARTGNFVFILAALWAAVTLSSVIFTSAGGFILLIGAAVFTSATAFGVINLNRNLN